MSVNRPTSSTHLLREAMRAGWIVRGMSGGKYVGFTEAIGVDGFDWLGSNGEGAVSSGGRTRPSLRHSQLYAELARGSGPFEQGKSMSLYLPVICIRWMGSCRMGSLRPAELDPPPRLYQPAHPPSTRLGSPHRPLRERQRFTHSNLYLDPLLATLMVPCSVEHSISSSSRATSIFASSCGSEGRTRRAVLIRC